MNIHVHIEDHIVKLVDIADTSSPHGEYVNSPNFEIMGTHLGITTLYVSLLLIDTDILCLQSAHCLNSPSGFWGYVNLQMILVNRSVLHSNLGMKF